MNALIVDDNDFSRAMLYQLATQVEDLVIVAQCENAMEAYNILQKSDIDILLLDIEMPEVNGIELTKHIAKDGPMVIFTTANKQYAAEAFELDVVDYIIKPVTQIRFLQALEKAREMLRIRQNADQTVNNNVFFVKDNNILKRISLHEVLYVEAMGDYIKIYTTKKFYTVHTTLKAFGEKLPASDFLRIHRSYIISVNKIDSIENWVVQIGQKSIVVAEASKAPLQKKLNLL